MQDLIKDFAQKKGRLATMRAVKHHMQYLAQLKTETEDRGISLVSDTGMGTIMRAVLVGCVEVENPDCVSRTHTRELARSVQGTLATFGPAESTCVWAPSDGASRVKPLRHIRCPLR